MEVKGNTDRGGVVKGQSPLPNVINPAVYTYGHEHVEVDPQGEPVLRLLVAQPVDQRRLVELGLQTVPQVPWYWTHTRSLCSSSLA